MTALEKNPEDPVSTPHKDLHTGATAEDPREAPSNSHGRLDFPEGPHNWVAEVPVTATRETQSLLLQGNNQEILT